MQRETWAMGTVLRIEVESAESRACALRLSEEIIHQVERAERLLSSWSDASEMSLAVAQPAGAEIVFSGELDSLLHEVEGWRSRTTGAFTAHIGALVDAWGIRAGGRVPTDLEISAAVEAVLRGTFDAGVSGWVRTNSPTWVDGGAFGKGWALRSAIARITRDAPGATATLDFGGQIVRVGGSGDEEWLPLAHPGDRSRAAISVRLPSTPVRTVATSGTAVRGRHLIDPRSGRPVDFEGSVTVTGQDPMVVDLLSTALFVLGPEEGLTLARREGGIDAIWLDANGRVLATTLPGDAIRRTFDSTRPEPRN